MTMTQPAPSLQEIKELLARAQQCLTCDASECHEFTPEGVDVCALLPWWNGRPVLRETLLEWNELVKRLEDANK